MSGIGISLWNPDQLVSQDVPLNGRERVVAKGGNLFDSNTYTSGFSRSERRSRVLLGGQPVNSLRFVYPNLLVQNGEKNGPNPLTVEFGLEKIFGGAQTVMGTFGGQSQVTLQPGEWIVSDPIYASQFGLTEFPANWDARCRTGSTIAVGDKWPFCAQQQFEQISGQMTALSSSPTSQINGTGPIVTPSGGTSSTTTNIAAFGPAAIIGEWVSTPDVSLMIGGDSIGSRLDDVDDNGTNGGGFITNGVRSVGGRSIANVKVAKGGELAFNWAAGNAFRKFLMGFCTHYIDNFGTNDMNSRTAAETLVSKQAIWADFRTLGKGPKYVVNVPVGPKANSTDQWATLANQTPLPNFGPGQRRDTLNAAVLALVGQPNGPDQVIDVNTSWQDSVETSKWVVNGTPFYPTSDNVHPRPTMHLLASATVSAAALTWTAT